MSSQPLTNELKSLDEKKQYYYHIVNTLLPKGSLALNSESIELSPNQNPDIRIYVGRELLDPENITNKQFKKLQQAIEKPETLKNGTYKGVVQIRFDNQPVFHNVRGEVFVDKFQITQSEQKLEQSSKTVQSDEFVVTNNSQVLGDPQNTINSFKQVIEKQQQRIEELESKLAFLSQSVNSIKNQSTSQWIGSTVASTAKGFGRVFTNWAEKKIGQLQSLSQNPPNQSIRYFEPLDMSAEQLASSQKAEASPHSNSWQISQLQEQLKEIQTNLKSLKHSFEQTVNHVQHTVEPIASATVSKVIEPAVGKVLHKMGVIYSPQNDTSTKVTSPAISQYQRLSQGIDKRLPPSVQVKQIAMAALKERFTPAQIQSILSHAPKFKEISSNLGADKANQFAYVALAAASRQNAIDTQPQQQHSSQKQSQYQA